MAVIRAEAIVLRRRLFSEASLVAVLLTRERGRLDILAKGCRREKSPLFGHLDLYQREEALILERSASSLGLLLEAGFVDEHAGLRFSPPAFAAAGLLADLAAEAVFPGDSQPGLFDVLAGALGILSDLGLAAARLGDAPEPPFPPAGMEALILRTVKLALLDMLARLGFGPELGRCLGCGKKIGPDEPARLSRRLGGLLCRSCRPGGGEPPDLDGPALAALRARGPGSEKLELALSGGERRSSLRFLVHYARQVLERPLPSGRVLFQLLGG